jgi:HD-like signal output (HDOD) protein
MRKHVLVVENEQRVRDALLGMLKPFRQQWKVLFAPTACAALEACARQPFDVIITDIRLPETTGGQLLAEVRKRFPATIRIILSRPDDDALLVDTVGVTHQYLPMPCDCDTLSTTIQRAMELRGLLTEEELKRLISQMGTLPSLPSLYFEIVREARSPDASIHKVAQIIAKDPAMTAKVMQLANSAFFGRPRSVSNPFEAVAYVGIDRIQHLVLSAHAFSRFEAPDNGDFSMETFWKHSMATAHQAWRIAEMEKAPKSFMEECFTAGILHDIGTLMLASRLPGRYSDALAWARLKQIPIWQAEHEILCATHASIGAYLLGLWGLPDSLVEAVAHHHAPEGVSGKEFCSLTALHVADGHQRESESHCPGVPHAEINLDYLATLGLQDRIRLWQEAA